MVWKKISQGVEMFEKPCLGNVKVVEGERFMALCLQPGTNRLFRGLARQVTNREGSEDVPGFMDLSKLVIVESNDLLKWKVIGDLKIENIDDVVEKFQKDNTRFIGFEDPDIVVDEEGVLHVYFTIAYSYLNGKEYDVFLGHAFGKSLENLRATNPLLGPIEGKFMGFKELAPTPNRVEGHWFHLVEGIEKGEEFGCSVIACIRASEFGKRWGFEKISLRPNEIEHSWYGGHVSPCRILSEDMIKLRRGLRVLLINGRAKNAVRKGKKMYGKFRPGLALYNPETGEIPWVDSRHLIEDPEATTITFASEVFALDEGHILVYSHVNDSFVRAYRVGIEEIKKRLPRRFVVGQILGRKRFLKSKV